MENLTFQSENPKSWLRNTWMVSYEILLKIPLYKVCNIIPGKNTGSNASSQIIFPHFLSFWRHFVLKNLWNHSNWWAKRGVFCNGTFQKWLVRYTTWSKLWWIRTWIVFIFLLYFHSSKKVSWVCELKMLQKYFSPIIRGASWMFFWITRLNRTLVIRNKSSISIK